jgi:hypothetical protein
MIAVFVGAALLAIVGGASALQLYLSKTHLRSEYIAG